ncbi:MAG: hypothetical protein Q9220_000770 [cf. Caloplaca sp. 1 TL-2023]
MRPAFGSAAAAFPIYRKVVRIGPNRISINSASALKSIYSASANTQKSNNYNVFHHLFKVPMVATIIDRKRHAFRRRIHAQALGASAVRGLEASLLVSVHKFINILDRGLIAGQWSQARNMTEWMAYLASDILGDVTFSRNWNLLESEENRNIPAVVAEGLGGLNLAGYMPFILTLRLDKILFRKLNRAQAQFQALSHGQSTWRAAQSNLPGNDLFANLLDSKDPQTQSKLTREELMAEAGILIVAGGDTVATVMTATLFYCLHYPETLLRLYEEIRSTFAQWEEIRMGDQLNSCLYLRACLDESMRMTPPVSALLPRAVLSGGLTIDDQHYPQGIDIGVPHYALHHNSDYYDDPFSFRPDRWVVNHDPSIDGTSKASLALLESAFCPFSVGRAACVGKTFAYQEMSIVLARILWRYDIGLQGKVGEGHEKLGLYRERIDEFQTWEGFVSTHDGPMVKFKRRS